MKKTLIAVLALAAVACNKAEVVEQSAANAISFDNAFVDNAVKSVVDPSYTNDKLFTDFAVYGFVQGATLFDGVKVTGSAIDGEWTYAGTQYWIAGAKYNFSAVAPFTGNWTKTSASKDGVTLSFTNNGTQDVLFAQTNEIEGKVSGNSKVAFTFKHILSKVKFSFENGYNATNATIKVKNIVITNPHKTADVVLDNATAWSNHAAANDFTLAFGMATDDEATNAKENAEVAYAFGKVYESQNELFLIPSTAAYAYNVTFVVDLLVSGTVVKTYNHTAKVDFAPAAGTCYDIKAVINATNIDPDHAQEPIEFTVTAINGWANPADGDDAGDEPDQPNAEIQ